MKKALPLAEPEITRMVPGDGLHAAWYREDWSEPAIFSEASRIPYLARDNRRASEQ
jgi:hypothetical protein